MTAPVRWLVVCALTLSGCSCGGIRGLDAGSTPDSGGDAPVALDAGVMPPDAWSPWLDGAPAELVCGEAAATECPTQDPASAHPCMSAGRVVFDGQRCQLATGSECGGEPGAFESLVECAFACEPTHCYPDAMYSPPGFPEPLVACPSRDELFLCEGLYAWVDLRLEDCAPLGPLDCAADPGAGSVYCGYGSPSEMADTPARIRAMTLLPFVRRVGCETAGP